MKNFKALALATLAAATAVIPTTVEAKNVDAGHMTLAQTAAQTGVQIKINPAACFEGNTYGWYWAAKNELVVCQERRTQVDVETYWTEEDFDTLRHEVQHLVQDCRDGVRDGLLDAVYTKPVELAKNVLGAEGVANVLRTYANSTDHIKVMELEAFSVAAMNDPAEQTQDIKTYCF